MHIPAKISKVPAGVIVCNIQGVNCPIRYVPIQSEKPAKDIARPRTLIGYISERSTQMIAHIDMAQQKI